MNPLDGVTGESIVAEIDMQRQVSPGSVVLLIEGPDDYALLQAHIDWSCVRLLITNGAENLEVALAKAEAQSIARVLAIRDRDFIGVLRPTPESENLVLTDRYDLEASLLLASDVLDRLVPQLTDMETLQAEIGTFDKAVISQRLVNLAEGVAVARMEGLRLSLGISLSDFPIHEVLASDPHDPDLEKLCRVAASAPDSTVDWAELHRLLSEAMEEAAYSAEQIVCGHDLLNILRYLAHRLWGGEKLGYDVVARIFRASVTKESLKCLSLYEISDSWAAANGVRVWAEAS